MRWWTLSQLKSKNPSTRLAAVEKLALDESKRAILLLIKALSDKDKRVRVAAANALAELQANQAAPALLSHLKDAEPEVRVAVIKALQTLGHEEAVSSLVEALGDSSGDVGWQAAQCLRSFAWQTGNDTERAAWHLALGEFGAVVSLGPAAIEPLARVTRDGVYHRCIKAVECLAEIGDPRAVKALLECLRSPEPGVRCAAATALGQVGDDRAMEPLLRALSDSKSQVSLAACAALSKFGDQRSVEPLIRLLKHPAPAMRAAALDGLGKLRDPRALMPMVALLEDAEAEVRESAAAGLGLLRDQRAIEFLVIVLTDPESTVRQGAARALRMIEPYWEHCDEARKAIPRLQSALKNKEYWVRHTAADVLNKLGRAQPREIPLSIDSDGAHQKKHAALRVLISMLTDRDRDFRQAAAEALGRLSLPDAIESLAARLSDNDRGVQMAAAQSLETLRWQPDNPVKRARLLVVLERWTDAAALGGDAVDALVEVVSWNEAGTRRRAIETLVRIGGARAISALRGIAADPNEVVRDEALAGLAILDGKGSASQDA